MVWTLALTLVAGVAACDAWSHVTPARAIGGTLDLRAWDPERDGPARLSGEWELYWGVLLPPDASSLSEPPPNPTGLFEIPGRWDGRTLGGETISTFGVGTYVLRVLLPTDAPPLGVRMRSVGTSYALFADGVPVASDGRVGLSAEASSPSRHPKVAPLPPHGGSVTLMLQVSNFAYRKGGPVEPFSIGSVEDLRNKRERDIAWGMFLAGAILVIGLHNFGQFLLRRRDRSPLHFGAFCLAIGTYALLVGERYLATLIPEMSWDTQVRLTNLTSFVALPLFVAFLHAVYPAELPRRLARSIEIAGMVLVVAVLVTPASVYSELLPVFHVLVLTTAVVASIVLVRAIAHRLEGAWVVTAGFSFFVATVVNDVLYDNVIIHTGQFIPLGLFVFVFSNSMLLSLRSARAFRTVEQQGAALSEANDAYRRELTERRQAEAALAESEARLRHSQKMEAIGALAGGVAHDFRNQLTVISGYADLLSNHSALDVTQKRRVDAIRQAADRSSRLTSQLLAFSRKQLLQPELLTMGTVVGELAPALRRMIPEDIELITHSRDGDTTVFSDRSQAEQAIINLCTNARDAMPGGGRLSLSTSTVTVDTREAEGRGAPGRYVVLSVTDSGEGMDEETSGRAFEPFFTTKAPGRGTGLGLSMVYGFAQQSGGWVTVDSAPGVGSTFRIYLPRSDRPHASSPVAPVEGGPTHGTETVLVVEDDVFVRALEVETLERHGYRVLAPRDTDEALRIGKEHPDAIHLLVTDVVMPGMSGPELSERICSVRPQLGVLYVSGYSENALVERGVVRNGTHLLTKPFVPDDLARMVRQVLDL